VSPEQIRDSHGADIRSDLYSLGCTLYHMLAGKAPFDGMSAVDKLWHHQTAEPVAVEVLRPDVPAPVAHVVRTLLAKKARDRYQDPGEVVAALRPYLIQGQDTMTDGSANTIPGRPVGIPAVALPRTEEIPLAHLGLLAEEVPQAMAAPITWKAWGVDWLNRLHWLIAALIAGVAMGLVIGRGYSIWLRHSLRRPLPDVLLQPPEHLAVPDERVLRLQDPVILVREVDQARRHSFLAQRVVVGQPLCHRHAVVLLAVQHEC